jgi:trans-2-enoyl-CoA reductase
MMLQVYGMPLRQPSDFVIKLRRRRRETTTTTTFGETPLSHSTSLFFFSSTADKSICSIMLRLHTLATKLVRANAISTLPTIFSRNFAQSPLKVVYNEHGKPSDVLRCDADTLEPLQASSVHVRMLAAPVNPADINMIEGRYALLAKLPAVGGNEGVGGVVDVGDAVTTLRVGDRVIPAHAGLGTWRSDIVDDAALFTGVPADVPLAAAATMAVNPCTAWRLLHDFVDLQPGDVVVQNGANSMVGQAVVQLCKHLGVHTVNIMRGDRGDDGASPTTQGATPAFDAWKAKLQGMGADLVVTEQFAQSRDMRTVLNKLDWASPGRRRLALNCVGGKSATELTRLVAPRATVVTYGGMSKRPVVVPTASLIFHDVTLRGFWLTRWSATASPEQRTEMLDALFALVRSGDLDVHSELDSFALDDFDRAIAQAQAPHRDRKVIFTMNNGDEGDDEK